MKTTTEHKAERMHNPPHPGEILKDLWLEPLGLTISKAAVALAVSRKTLSRIVNGRAPVTPDMAMRIAIAFNSRAGLWLDMQAQHDAWQVEQRRPELEKVVSVVRWEMAA